LTVKLPVSDLLDDCAVEDIALGNDDAALGERVKARVLGELARREKQKTARLRRTVRLALLLAAALLLCGGLAYAAGAFRVSLAALPAEAVESHQLVLEDEEGNELVYTMGDRFEDGMTFRFSGEGVPRRVEFRPKWLPEEPTLWLPYDGMNDPDVPLPAWDAERPGWYWYLIDDREAEAERYPAEGVNDVGIPVLIEVEYTMPGRVLMLMGSCELVGQESWDNGVEVYEIACARDIYEYGGTADERHLVCYENYVLLYSRDGGWLINIGGTAELETLLHIARELEIHETGEEMSVYTGMDQCWVSSINIARG